MTDYIDLTPDDILRVGDECQELVHRPDDEYWWTPVRGMFGKKVSEFSVFRFRRPRSTLIRDAAIELLRREYGRSRAYLTIAIFENQFPEYRALREAVYISIEELLQKTRL